MYITKKLLKEIDFRKGKSSRTHSKPPEVSQPLKKDKTQFSLNCTKVKQGEAEKLHFSKEEF